MTKKEIIDYVMTTVYNTNPNVLSSLLDQLNNNEITPEMIYEAVKKYLDEHPIEVTPIDKTLTKEDYAADAKTVGDTFKDYISKKRHNYD